MAFLLAYCQLDDHFHLVLHTRRASPSWLTRHVNGVYKQSFNRRLGLAGRLYQGRFKAMLVDTDTYLLALCRYVERNPVAARLAAKPEDCMWSSCRAHTGLVNTPGWSDSVTVYGQLQVHPAVSAKASQSSRAFVCRTDCRREMRQLIAEFE